jgi:hypothetical protein
MAINPGTMDSLPASGGSKTPERSLSCTAEKNGFSTSQRSSNRLQSAFKVWQILENRCGSLPGHHGSQELALTHKLLIVMD